ncbi:MAG: hypothetical protein UX74_C0033G0001, partial [Parcubacteria group bacterium GW2011_GWA2_47_10b]
MLDIFDFRYEVCGVYQLLPRGAARENNIDIFCAG